MLAATTTSCPCIPRCDCVPWREPAWSRCGRGARLLTRLFDPCRPGWSGMPACTVLWARCAHLSAAWVAAAEPLVRRRAAAERDWAAPTTVNPLRDAHRTCTARRAPRAERRVAGMQAAGVAWADFERPLTGTGYEMLWPPPEHVEGCPVRPRPPPAAARAAGH
jgi:hypothetical protein